MTILCMLRGARHEYRREPAGEKWCFNCRKRLHHDNVLIGEPPPPKATGDKAIDEAAFQAWLDQGYGYYGADWRLVCSGCGGDCTRFPGTTI